MSIAWHRRGDCSARRVPERHRHPHAIARARFELECDRRPDHSWATTPAVSRRYAVGDRALPPLGRLAAAVYAAGTDAIAARRSAGALASIRAHAGTPEVIARPGTRKHAGIEIMRTAIEPDEICIIQGIRTTTVARTLLDLGTLGDDLVKHAVKQAEFLGVFDLAEVSRLLDRYPRRRGTARLRRVISEFEDSAVRTRSEMEERFWALVLDEDLPRPEVNGTLELGAITIEPDAMWPDAKVIVELDSRQAHATYDAFETDRERDRAAALKGMDRDPRHLAAAHEGAEANRAGHRTATE